MLGLAVVDAPAVDEPVTVWLTSWTSGSWVEHTNAVAIEPGEVAPARVVNMVADRYVFLTDRSTAVTDVLPEVPLRAATWKELHDGIEVEAGRLRDEFAAEQTRRRQTKKSRLVEPRWPHIPQSPPAEADGHDGVPVALPLANSLRELWSVWAKLEELRVQRAYLTPEDPAPRPVPPQFADTFTPHPLPSRS